MLTIFYNIIIFAVMKLCYRCNREITLEHFIGRREQCSFCSADLHCCRNCDFYEPGSYNDCRETQAERVLDKTSANFCDFFRLRQTNNKNNEKQDAKDKLAALFKN